MVAEASIAWNSRHFSLDEQDREKNITNLSNVSTG
jgi:hypothetical protein